MRRDYFICIFLLCICASLFFVCFLPLYFEYNLIVPRHFALTEMILSWLFALMVLIIIPAYSAVRKKFWFTAGLAVYGIVANIPEWLLPKLAAKLQGDNASLVAVISNYILRFMYGCVKAPFAGMSPALGNKMAVGLSKWILPSSILFYVVVQLFRFYRDAYVADQLDPSRVVDSTAAENNGAMVAARRRETRKAEVLGTVISAPVTPDSKTVKSPSAPKETSQVFPVNHGAASIPQSPRTPSVEGGTTQRVPAIPKPASSSDTQVIQLGPPKGEL